MKKRILYALLASALTGGGLWVSAAQEAPPEEEPDLEEFEPTERFPAGSAVSFPVDI